VGGIGPLQGLARGTMGAHLTPALSPTPGPPGSTRKLYERKICEYESQRTKLSPPGGYSGEWGARRGGEGPAAAATDLPPFLCVSSLPTPDPATTETYIRESYSYPQQEERHRYGADEPAPVWCLKPGSLVQAETPPVSRTLASAAALRPPAQRSPRTTLGMDDLTIYQPLPVLDTHPSSLTGLPQQNPLQLCTEAGSGQGTARNVAPRYCSGESVNWCDNTY
uniref:Uncharacterized protein n=1 Tax=Chelonoidis abingdonii TaxID=106734 RepID=A0A8C0HER5_CHEAB